MYLIQLAEYLCHPRKIHDSFWEAYCKPSTDSSNVCKAFFKSLIQSYFWTEYTSFPIPPHPPPQTPQVVACLDLGRVEGRENGYSKLILGQPKGIQSLSFLAIFSSLPFVFSQRTLHSWLLNQGEDNVKHINLSMKQSLSVDKRKLKK